MLEKRGYIVKKIVKMGIKILMSPESFSDDKRTSKQ